MLMHQRVELEPAEREYDKSILMDTGLTEDEAEMMLEDFEMGY